MATTLRRSRSKYGRTRRQRRKQRHIRGGGFLDDIVNKFKPKSAQEKCKEAEQEAENICNSSGSGSGAEGDIEMTELAPSSDASVNETSNNDAIAGFTPVTPSVDGGDVEIAEVMPQPIEPLETSNTEIMPPGMSQPDIEQKPLQPQPLPQLPASKFSGGAKKSKKNNKKRSQSRRKKLKSKKHK